MMNPRSILTITLPLIFASVAQAHTDGGGHMTARLPFGLDPAHLHLLTNHIPIFITFSGLVALALALLWKNDVAKRVALVLLIIGTVGGLFTYWLGQHAYKPVRGLADETGQDRLDVHMERAEQVIWLFWLAALSAAAALLMSWRKLKGSFGAVILAGVLGAGTLAVSGWIGDAGGKIRHSEIRGDSQPPADDAKEGAPHEH
jgi:membrane protein YqaA with SNARE-associated domain